MANLVKYPCPLGDGEFCYLLLPNPFDWKTASRIITFIQVLALEPEKAESGDAVARPDGNSTG